MVCTSRGTSLGLHRERNSDTCCDTDRPQGWRVQGAKPVAAGRLLCASTYLWFSEESRPQRQTVSGWSVTRDPSGRGSECFMGDRVSVWEDENLPETVVVVVVAHRGECSQCHPTVLLERAGMLKCVLRIFYHRKERLVKKEVTRPWTLGPCVREHARGCPLLRSLPQLDFPSLLPPDPIQGTTVRPCHRPQPHSPPQSDEHAGLPPGQTGVCRAAGQRPPPSAGVPSPCRQPTGCAGKEHRKRIFQRPQRLSSPFHFISGLRVFTLLPRY